MSHASVAEAVALYGEDFITTTFDRDNDGDLDTDACQQALDAATNEIDGWLIGRVDGWPLDAIPPQIKRYCIDMAVYIGSPTADVGTSDKSKRYDAAVHYLEMVAMGKVRLVPVVADVPSQADTVTLQPQVLPDRVITVEAGCDRQFTRTKLRSL